MNAQNQILKKRITIVVVLVSSLLVSRSSALLRSATAQRVNRWRKAGLSMVLTPSSSRKLVNESLNAGDRLSASLDSQRKRIRRKYKRKRIPESEKEVKSLRKERQAEYEQIVSNARGKSPSIWSFESLFPEPVLDEETIQRDLYEVRKRDSKTDRDRKQMMREVTKMRSSFYGGNSMMRVWREPRLNSAFLANGKSIKMPMEGELISIPKGPQVVKEFDDPAPTLSQIYRSDVYHNLTGKVDRDLTRMVEDRIYGYRRSQSGDYQYDTSLMGDGAVQFRDGIRLGNPLRVNTDRLNFLAKKEMQHGRVEEAQEFYEKAIEIDPRDGRAYLGLSRCAQRRRDFELARAWLQAGLRNSVSTSVNGERLDRGANPFLLQALGYLDERMGRLSEAEALYISAVRSRPTHAASWVSLAQLRTRKLGQGASAGRLCLQTAEREIKRAGLTPPAHVYTAWGSLEYEKANDSRRARELYKMALDIDPKCSVAWLLLGVMETDCENWDEAQKCFETVLQFDQRNSRVLQAYALMETKRPNGNSRKAIDLFERALKANPRDAGVLQPYALYVAELGDIKSARKLLHRATEVNKRHAAAWQAWGVLEMRNGSVEEARNVFQQGIWACAQITGVQSGGYRCARLWQAWGVLEAREGDHAAARRCFSRSLDADSRNVPAITAWAQMEAELGNARDARAIFERAINKFSAGSAEKNILWRSYELMEQRLGNVPEAQQVYRRSMRETITYKDESLSDAKLATSDQKAKEDPELNEVLKRSKEVEVVRWNGSSLGGEVWLNDRAIESKLPFSMKKKKRKKNP